MASARPPEKRGFLFVRRDSFSAHCDAIQHPAAPDFATPSGNARRSLAGNAGLTTQWDGADGQWFGWLPHPDLTAARAFTTASATHDLLWKRLARPGVLTLHTQLDLWNILQPMTQPNSQLDYTPDPETVTVVFSSDAELKTEAAGAIIQRVSNHESRLTVTALREHQRLPLTLTVATPVSSLDVSFSTA